MRQILDGLVKANGNALWIAEFDREVKEKSEESKQPWRFVPLRGGLPTR